MTVQFTVNAKVKYKVTSSLNVMVMMNALMVDGFIPNVQMTLKTEVGKS